MKRILERHHRQALRDLLLGYVEHCEIAPNLHGTLEQTFYHERVKYGVPAFTFRGTPAKEIGMLFVGLVAGRRGADRLSAEVTLQLIERLVLQPSLGEGYWLRILPVLDPVGLERERTPEGDNSHAVVDESIRLRCGDGVIEIATEDRPGPAIGLRGPPQWRQAARLAVEDLKRLSSELDGVAPDARFQFSVQELPKYADVPWNLYFALPASWNPSEATHFASQWLLVFLRRLRQLAPTPAESTTALAGATHS